MNTTNEITKTAVRRRTMGASRQPDRDREGEAVTQKMYEAALRAVRKIQKEQTDRLKGVNRRLGTIVDVTSELLTREQMAEIIADEIGKAVMDDPANVLFGMTIERIAIIINTAKAAMDELPQFPDGVECSYSKLHDAFYGVPKSHAPEPEASDNGGTHGTATTTR